ncbi:MAG: 16S rRNA (cytosine(1402)-N(4))-methyltransferase RsmH [Actinobacteria bacterium]|nr:16S rRNA (cytosine(1402)-N(4))-methyltransferase RsmH [Actinomycetota bacterium]
MTGPRHEPVMLAPILELLGPAIEGVVPDRAPLLIDATLGLGGHSEALLRSYPQLLVLGIDRDHEALALAQERLAGFGDRFRTEHGRFDLVLERLPPATAPVAILFDLGVSSLQIDSDARGFAYARDTPLDMRMDQTGGLSAADVVNDYEPEELARVIRKYGEERDAWRIASAVVRARDENRITTTGQLSDVIAAAVRYRPGRGHPAKRTFQALRIEVNDELTALQAGLETGLRLLAPGGRAAVLSFHSLEDRIVKRTFAQGIRPEVPHGLPVVPADRRPWLSAVTRGALPPDPLEVSENPRAASAKLRVVEKVAA